MNADLPLMPGAPRFTTLLTAALTLTLASPCHAASAQTTARTTDQPTAQASPATRPWLADPLRTAPARLDQALRPRVPPDLAISTPTPATTPPRNPDGEKGDNTRANTTLDPGCATRAAASDPDNPRWALQTLRASNTGANANASLVLSLPIAIQLAICHNPQLRASWSQIAQQTAQLGQAQSAYWPQIDLGSARERSRVSYANAPGTLTQTTALNTTLNWRLWDFGARAARVQAAQAQVQAALDGQNLALKQAIAAALRAYTQAQAAQARLHTQRQLLPLANRNLLAAQRRQAGGAGSANDTLQAAAAQARIQLEQSRAEGDLRKANAQLTYQTGLPPGTSFELPPLLPASPANPAVDRAPTDDDPTGITPATQRLLARALDDWLADARQRHPAIAAARAQLQAAQANLQAAQAERLPTVNLNLSHYDNGRPSQTPSAVRSSESAIGVSLNFRLFTGFDNTYKINAAQAAVEQKQIELQTTEQQTLLELVQQHAQAHASLNNLRAAANLYRTASAAALSAQRQYEHGAIDILQLNQPLIALQQAQDDLVRAQLEWSQARLDLWLAAMPVGSEP